MLYYTEEIDDVLVELKTTPDGLSQSEAAVRLAQDGPNELVQRLNRRFFNGFLRNWRIR